MTDALSVRPARLGDLTTIVELRLALLREYHDHPLYMHLRSDAPERAFELYSAQLLSPHEAMFVAESGAHVVGILRCVDTPSSPLLLPERYCYVSSVYVAPMARRKGVLRALLAAADRWCEERGIDEMRLHNSATSGGAAQAWSALGFEVVEQVRRRPLTTSITPTAAVHVGAEAS
ncbi:MAG: GNAT family N-acetyltransferase [bacterium]